MSVPLHTSFVVTVFFWASVSRADVDNFTRSPATPVMGEMVTDTAVNDGSRQVTSWLWEFKYGECYQLAGHFALMLGPVRNIVSASRKGYFV